ncbi:MAG: helix-turn-helix transcriptional regulator [Chloroflexi bacterium]|nr:helix-turn-helix transcriptional regulator [Chloroflexota bacterium]
MPDEILVQFGKKVREERRKQRLSQEQLAEKAGLHRTYIGMIERAEKNITLENINKICKALALDLSAIFKDLHDC